MSVLRKMSGFFFGIPYDDDYERVDRSEVRSLTSSATMQSIKEEDEENDTSTDINADDRSRMIQEPHAIEDGEEDGVEMEEIRSSSDIQVSVQQPHHSHLQYEEENESDGDHDSPQGNNPQCNDRVSKLVFIYLPTYPPTYPTLYYRIVSYHIISREYELSTSYSLDHIYLSIYLSIFLPTYLSIYLSI